MSGRSIAFIEARDRRRVSRRGSASLAVAGFTASLACAPPVYLARHTEKALDQGDDPDLTAQGRARARALAEALPRRPRAIFVTPWRRTWQTAAPTAHGTGAAITELDAHDVDGLLVAIEAADGPVLVIGHSNTLPEILRALGVDPDHEASVEEPGVEYGMLFVVRPARREGGPVRARVVRFGTD